MKNLLTSTSKNDARQQLLIDSLKGTRYEAQVMDYLKKNGKMP